MVFFHLVTSILSQVWGTSWGLRIFYLSHACDETKNIFLYSLPSSKLTFSLILFTDRDKVFRICFQMSSLHFVVHIFKHKLAAEKVSLFFSKILYLYILNMKFRFFVNGFDTGYLKVICILHFIFVVSSFHYNYFTWLARLHAS